MDECLGTRVEPRDSTRLEFVEPVEDSDPPIGVKVSFALYFLIHFSSLFFFICSFFCCCCFTLYFIFFDCCFHCSCFCPLLPFLYYFIRFLCNISLLFSFIHLHVFRAYYIFTHLLLFFVISLFTIAATVRAVRRPHRDWRFGHHHLSPYPAYHRHHHSPSQQASVRQELRQGHVSTTT